MVRMIAAALALGRVCVGLALGVLTLPPNDCFGGGEAIGGSICMVVTAVSVPLLVGTFFLLAWLVVWAITRLRWWSVLTVLIADLVGAGLAIAVSSLAPGLRIDAVVAAVALGTFVGVSLAPPRGTPRSTSVIVALLGVVAAGVAVVARAHGLLD